MRLSDKEIKVLLRTVTTIGLVMVLIMLTITGCSSGKGASKGSSSSCLSRICPCVGIFNNAMGIVKPLITILVAILIILPLALLVMRKVKVANVKANAAVAKEEAKQARRLINMGGDSTKLDKPGGIDVASHKDKAKMRQFDKEE